MQLQQPIAPTVKVFHDTATGKRREDANDVDFQILVQADVARTTARLNITPDYPGLAVTQRETGDIQPRQSRLHENRFGR